MKARYFKNFYGSTASIKPWRNYFTLTIRLADGSMCFKKDYATYKGARIALGRTGDCWKENV